MLPSRRTILRGARYVHYVLHSSIPGISMTDMVSYDVTVTSIGQCDLQKPGWQQQSVTLQVRPTTCRKRDLGLMFTF